MIEQTRTYYVPMRRTHIDKLDRRWAYCCLSQNREGLECIREHLNRDDIDAAMFVTETGDYTEIYVSFYQGMASFDNRKQWFKVVS